MMGEDEAELIAVLKSLKDKERDYADSLHFPLTATLRN
jgi:hypothetical protein